MNTDRPAKTADEKILRLARDTFKRASEKEQDTRMEALDDLKFARLGEQWPDQIKTQRELDGRPCLTINKMPSFIRQVVNDARQNKPAIAVNPADDKADPETAEIINGLIRNIQVSSDADIATDTAIESAVSNGFGYFRINIVEDEDDVKDIAFERICNPFEVYGDPYSEAADSSDWNTCVVAKMLSKDEFESRYNDAEAVDWDAGGYIGLPAPWIEGDEVMVAEFWHRVDGYEEVVDLSDGTTQSLEWWEASGPMLELEGVIEVNRRQRKCKKVTQYILTGAKVLETNEWPGKHIPIVPVYGDEINVEGKRYFRSLIYPAKDAQRMHNYWRTTATELVALAPKTPFMVEEGSIVGPAKWATANHVAHAYLEFKKGAMMPQRQPFAGVPAGVLQEALNAADDMKGIMGIYDASLGARSNETSGVAINARKMEGDVSTFHFIDNLSRSIRHAGRIIINLIQKVYAVERVVRVLGEDMKPKNVKIAPGAQQNGEQMGVEDDGDDTMSGMTRVFDLTAGKYDLIVKSGPNYSTLREQTRTEIVEIIRSFPAAAPVLGPMYLRHSDWPGADDAADKLEGIAEQEGAPQQPMPEPMSQADQIKAQNEAEKNQIAREKVGIDGYDAETRRMVAQSNQIRAEAKTAFAGAAGDNLY